MHPAPAPGRPAPPSWRLRTATLSDCAAIVALVEAAYRGDASRAGWTTEADLLDGRRTDQQGVAEAIGAAGSRMILAESRGRVEGCCQVSDRRDGTAYFGMFAVDPTLQGGGLGSCLLAEAEQVAAGEIGATRIVMSVIRQRADLLAWYGRRGYRPTGETQPFPYGDERFGIPRVPDLEFVVLAKALGPEGEGA